MAKLEFAYGSGYALVAMSKSEIIMELSKLDKNDRREIARRIFELEDDAQVLADADRRADERFLMLDAMETKDGKTDSR